MDLEDIPAITLNNTKKIFNNFMAILWHNKDALKINSAFSRYVQVLVKRFALLYVVSYFYDSVDDNVSAVDGEYD